MILKDDLGSFQVNELQGNKTNLEKQPDWILDSPFYQRIKEKKTPTVID